MLSTQGFGRFSYENSGDTPRETNKEKKNRNVLYAMNSWILIGMHETLQERQQIQKKHPNVVYAMICELFMDIHGTLQEKQMINTKHGIVVYALIWQMLMGNQGTHHEKHTKNKSTETLCTQ